MKLNKQLSEVDNLSQLKILLRAKQWQKALNGDVQMLKFLGINYLNQTDKTDLVIQKEKEIDTVEVLDSSDPNYKHNPNAIVIH